jgi:predicted phosphodiesterase
MKKILVIPDIHGRDYWKKVVNQHIDDVDQIVFLGDYFDSFDIKPLFQIHNFKEIMEIRKMFSDKVITLIGNHDYHYLRFTNSQYSGYNNLFQADIYDILKQNLDYLQICCIFDDKLFSHAGVSNYWLKLASIDSDDIENLENNINKILQDFPQYLDFAYLRPENSSLTTRYPNSYGDNFYQTPIWIRPMSLMSNDALIKDITQVVGHTHQNNVKTKVVEKTNSKFIFTDVYDTLKDEIIIL